jgi:SOS-response transcriptional repressor LexA
MTFGQRLFTLRKAKKLSQTSMANDLKMKQTSIHDYEKDRTSPSIETIQNIASVYNCNLHWLITGKGHMFLSDNTAENFDLLEFEAKIEQKVSNLVDKHLSNYGKKQVSKPADANDYWYLTIQGDISCGEPMPFNEDDEELLIPISKAKLQNPNDCDILRVNGESMYPDIEHADLVVIRKESSWEVCSNRIVAVRNDDGLTLKKLVMDERKRTAMLVASNKKYFPILVDESCVLCGYLVLLIRHY